VAEGEFDAHEGSLRRNPDSSPASGAELWITPQKAQIVHR
jgi:hypothetical protein